jgi:predicted secreted protein with PEFG-CTERM motif
VYYRIIFIVIAVGITFGLTPTIAAVEDPISVSTSRDIYYENDIIIVFGKVTSILNELPVTIQLYHEDSLIAVDQVEIALDGTFATDFRAKGNFWKEDGTYIVRAFYTPEKIAEKTFQFFKKLSGGTSSLFPVDIPNSGSFEVGYSIIGGEVRDIILNQDNYSILTEINADSNGNLVLKLPRENIESKTNDGMDEIFIILISKTGLDSEDFVEVQFEEIETGPDFRTVRIQFEEDDRWIKIVGTYVIPEFGTIVTMILLIAVTTTIVMYKSKFSIKYN